jgi:hypothetical protein
LKFKLALTAFVVAVATMLVGSWGANPVHAQPPPTCTPGTGVNDYCFEAFIDTAPGNPDTWTHLELGTNDAPASPDGTPPSMAFFDAATTTFGGALQQADHKNDPNGLGAKTGEISFSIQTNVNPALAGNILTTGNIGQPPRCGDPNTLRVTALPFDMYNARVLTTVEAGNPANQVSDLDSQVPGPDGRFQGITHEPVLIQNLVALGAFPRALIVGRSYGVASTIAGETSVNFLTLGPIPGAAVAPMYATVVLLGDPTSPFDPAGQTAATCPPFLSTVQTLGTTEEADWGGIVIAGGTTRQTLTGEPGFFQLALSSGSNLDSEIDPGSGNNRWNPWDNCKLVVNTSQAGNNGIGDACAAVATSGYDPAGATDTHASLNCTSVVSTGGAGWTSGNQTAVSDGPPWAPCQDNSGDGVLNFVDNCPLHSNPDQLGQDGIGFVCNPSETVTRGDGQGYPPNGTYFDRDDICRHLVSDTGAVAPVQCFNRDFGVNYRDSADNGTPDFLNLGSGTACVQDHKSDTNQSGYSDADETSPSGSKACSGAFPASPAATNAALLRNALQECPGRNTTTLRRFAASDVNLDRAVNIQDISLIAGQFGAALALAPNTDFRHAMDVNRDGNVNIQDVSIAAGFFGGIVPPC